MEWILMFAAVGLGLIMGSFLNVVILRYNTGRSLEGRSACFSCKSVLRWYELIPVGSYVVQAGRCRRCGSVLSPQYPLVELLTAALFLGLFLKFYDGVLRAAAVVEFGVYAAITSLLVVILVYDLHHKIIPNGLVYAAAALAFGSLFVDVASLSVVAPSILALMAGPLVALPFVVLWLVSQGRWMGFGDAKLGLVMGWMLGISGGFTAVLFAFWAGALVSLVLLAAARLTTRQVTEGNSLLLYRTPVLTMKSEVPFAPFLIASLWFVFFSGFNLFTFLGFF